MAAGGMMKGDFQRPYYADLAARHGNSREVAGWGSQNSQEGRFAIFADCLPIAGQRLLDVGCGRGDLLAYLKRTGNAPAHYVGVDLMPEIAAFARANHPEADIRCGDLLDPAFEVPEVDFAVSSGVFNLTGPDHEQWVAAMLAAIYRRCRRGMAINIISRFAPEHKPDHYYADPSTMLAMGLALSPYAVLRHDYAIHDMTLVVLREPRTA